MQVFPIGSTAQIARAPVNADPVQVFPDPIQCAPGPLRRAATICACAAWAAGCRRLAIRLIRRRRLDDAGFLPPPPPVRLTSMSARSYRCQDGEDGMQSGTVWPMFGSPMPAATQANKP
jgi:hypothetical protein